MNCQDFEKIAGELANDEVMSAITRVNALAHAEACQACADVLSNQRALANALRGLAESSASEQASAKLKLQLRAAFDAQQLKLENVPAPPVANVIQMPIRNWRWRWTLAAAAAVAIIFALALFVWINNQPADDGKYVAEVPPTPQLPPTEVTPKPADVSENTNPQLAAREKENDKLRVKQQKRNRRQLSEPAIENNLAANYIPIGYYANSGVKQDKLIVRVEVQRSTLIAMGLPLNAARGNELVKADLMVGLDGVPLAIRLVRQ